MGKLRAEVNIVFIRQIKTIARCCIAAFVLLVMPKHALSVPVRISFEGTLTSVSYRAEDFFNIGDKMFGHFVYESSTPYIHWPGRFEPFVFPDHGFVTVGTHSAQLISGGSVHVYDDIILNLPDPTVVDQFTAGTFAEGPILGGTLRPRTFGINFWDLIASSFDGSQLPTSLPPLSKFPPLPSHPDVATAMWNFNLYHLDWEIPLAYLQGSLTAYHVAIIPEPTAFGLIVTAFVTMFVQRRPTTRRS